jgi:hypothetical protein
MLTEHLQPLQALVVGPTEGEQTLITSQSNRCRGIVNCLIRLKGIERIKIFFGGQLARQQIWIQRKAGGSSIPLLASIFRHDSMLRDPVKSLRWSTDWSGCQHVARQPNPGADSEQRQGE